MLLERDAPLFVISDFRLITKVISKRRTFDQRDPVFPRERKMDKPPFGKCLSKEAHSLGEAAFT